MDYVEPRGNLWYAVYYVPADVRVGSGDDLRAAGMSIAVRGSSVGQGISPRASDWT